MQSLAFDRTRYATLAEKNKESLAAQLAQFLTALHSVSEQQVEKASIRSAPSWRLSTDLIEEQLVDEEEPAVRALLPQVVRNHKALQVPASNVVFGHFDLHGGNIRLDDAHERIVGVVGFRDCKRGDLHQDLSVMNLSSPDLAERMGRHYRALSGRDPNRLLVQHYTTVLYLHLLAVCKRKGASEKYRYWLGELQNWHEHLLTDRKAAGLPDRWRKWLASNLMSGGEPEVLGAILRQNGYADREIAREIALARQHPYVQAGEEIFRSVAKRNWLLKTCDELAALDPRYATRVEVREAPPFDEFVRQYYSKHLPVVLTGAVAHWPALAKWSPDYFAATFGDREIEVQLGRESDPQFERNAGSHRRKMTMREFVALVREGGPTNNYYMTANNTHNSMAGIEPLFDDVGDFASGYRNPEAQRSATFLWFGPRGTFTPLHHDLTNNMLVQILGRKKLTLVPAWQAASLYNDRGVFSATDFPKFDDSRFPLLRRVTPIEVVLHPGEALFIPVGWWHCVESLDVSISISFTNFNAPNQFAVDFPQ